jgi:hypothetical protein
VEQLKNVPAPQEVKREVKPEARPIEKSVFTPEEVTPASEKRRVERLKGKPAPFVAQETPEPKRDSRPQQVTRGGERLVKGKPENKKQSGTNTVEKVHKKKMEEEQQAPSEKLPVPQ